MYNFNCDSAINLPHITSKILNYISKSTPNFIYNSIIN
jgi:hypothetical protein